MSSTADHEITTSTEKPTLEPILTSAEYTDSLSAEISENPSKTQHAKSIGTTTPEVEGEEQEPAAAVEEYPTTPVSAVDPKSYSSLRLTEVPEEPPLPPQPKELNVVEDSPKEAEEKPLSEPSPLEDEQLDGAQGSQPEVIVQLAEIQDKEELATIVGKPLEASIVEPEISHIEQTAKPIETGGKIPSDDLKLGQAEDIVASEEHTTSKKENPPVPDALEKTKSQEPIPGTEEPKAAPEPKSQVSESAVVEHGRSPEAAKPISELLGDTLEPVSEDIRPFDLGDELEEARVGEEPKLEESKGGTIEPQHTGMTAYEVSEEPVTIRPPEGSSVAEATGEVADPQEKKEVGVEKEKTVLEEGSLATETAVDVPEPSKSESQPVAKPATSELEPDTLKESLPESNTGVIEGDQATVGALEASSITKDELAVVETPEIVAEVKAEELIATPAEAVPAVEEIKTTDMERAPVAEKVPAVEETSIIEEKSAIEEEPVVRRKLIVGETLSIEKSVAIEEAPGLASGVNAEESAATVQPEVEVVEETLESEVVIKTSEVEPADLESTTAEKAPIVGAATVEEAPIAKGTPENEGATVIEEPQTIDGVPVIEVPAVETLIVKEVPEVEDASVVEEVSTVTETPVLGVEQAPVVNEAPLVEETPIIEEGLAGEALAVGKTPIADGSSEIDGMLATKEVSTVEGSPNAETEDALAVGPESLTLEESLLLKQGIEPEVEARKETEAVGCGSANIETTTIEEAPEVDETVTAEAEIVPEGVERVKETSIVEQTPVVEDKAIVEREPSTEEFSTAEGEVTKDQELTTQEAPVVEVPATEKVSIVESLPAAEQIVAAGETVTVEDSPKQGEEIVSSSNLKEAVAAEPVFDPSQTDKLEPPKIEEPRTENAVTPIEEVPNDTEETVTTVTVENKEEELSKELENTEAVEGEPVIEDIEIMVGPSMEEAVAEKLLAAPATATESSFTEKEETQRLGAKPSLEDLIAAAGGDVESELKPEEILQFVEETSAVEGGNQVQEGLAIENIPLVGETFSSENATVVGETTAGREVPAIKQGSTTEDKQTTETITIVEEKSVEKKAVDENAAAKAGAAEQKYIRGETAVEELKSLEPTEGVVSPPKPEEEATDVSEIKKVEGINEPEMTTPAAFEIEGEAQEETSKETVPIEESELKVTEAVIEPEDTSEVQELEEKLEVELATSKVPVETAEVISGEHVDVPEVIVELTTENQPSHGDDLGPDATLGHQEAFENRKQGAEPDKIIVVEESPIPGVVLTETAEPIITGSEGDAIVEPQEVKLPEATTEEHKSGEATGNEPKTVEKLAFDEDDAVVISHDDAKPEEVAEAEAAVQAPSSVEVDKLEDAAVVIESALDGTGTAVETQLKYPDVEVSGGEISVIAQEEFKDISVETVFHGEVTNGPLQEVSINPLPASETFGNPIDLAPGERVPDLGASSVDSNVKLDQESYEHADASNLGVKAQTEVGEQVFSVNPLPVFEAVTSPINLQPGEPVPELKTAFIEPAVKLDAESYEKADASNFEVKTEDAIEEEPEEFFIKPLPASGTATNPIDLQPGEPVPTIGFASVESNVKFDEESYEKADASNFGARSKSPTAQPEEFSVKPLPASETATNPTDLQPGEPVPEIGSASIVSSVKLDEESYERADASNLGVSPQTETEEQVFSVSPLPASETATNPIDLQPGEPVPIIGSASVESNVKLDEDSYEKADASNFGIKSQPAVEEVPREFLEVSINPFPASQTPGNPIELQPGEPIPSDQLSAESIDANVRLDEESYEKADASNFGVPPFDSSAHLGVEDTELVLDSAGTTEPSVGAFSMDGATKEENVIKEESIKGITEDVGEPTVAPGVGTPSVAVEDAFKSSDVVAEGDIKEETKGVELEGSFVPVETKVEPGLFVDKSTGEIIAPTVSDPTTSIVAASALGGAALICGATAIIAHPSSDKQSSSEAVDNKTHTKSAEDAEEPKVSKQVDELIIEPAPQTASSPVHGIVIPEGEAKQVVEDANTSDAPAIVVSAPPTSPTVGTSQEVEERTVEVIEPTPEVEGSAVKTVERESENTPEGVRRRRLVGAMPGSRPVSSGNDTVSTKNQKHVMRAFWNVLFLGWLGGFGRLLGGMFGKSKKAQRPAN